MSVKTFIQDLSFILIFITTFTLSAAAHGADDTIALPVPLGEVFQKERSTDEDTIYLRNTDVLTGKVINESLTMTTPYGDVTVQIGRCAGISFEGSRANTECLVTTNYNRFTGILKDRTVKFKIGSSGAELDIRKEKIQFILMKKTANEVDFVDPKSKSDLFVMANGDLLTGEPDNPKIEIQTEYGKVPVSFEEIKDIEMQGGDKIAAKITKKNKKDTMTGTLITEEITLILDVGAKMEGVFKDKFSKIFVDDGIQHVAAQFGVLQPIMGESEGALTGKPDAFGGQVITNSIGMKMVYIKPGEFMMGSEKHIDAEKPVHKVKLTKGFYIGVYEVTQEQYEKVMGNNPSHFKGKDLPVDMVSCNDAEEFCKKLSEKEGKTYRLPTEAEWEYACRAGSKTEYYWGDRFDGKYAWYRDNSGGKTHTVGTREPNKWGLYDMSGNVWEWCQDWYKSGYPAGEQVDPEGPASSDSRVLRGGSWGSLAGDCRSAFRYWGRPGNADSSFGFRVVRASEK